MAQEFYSFEVKATNGQSVALSDYRGKVVLVVNVASRCGYTPQYDGLQKLYSKYRDQGLVILGFPCNQFGAQEPGSNDEIQSFCQMNFGVEFPIFKKIDVNGAHADPLFGWLKKSAPGILGTEMIKWNFTKFLIGRDGQVIDRFAPQTTPLELEKPIEAALSAK
jgi:glutathione peroxidase